MTGQRCFDVLDPATDRVLARVPDQDADAARAAVAAAAGALEGWSSTAPRGRADVLHRAYQQLADASPRLSALITSENGKSERDAVAEVAYAAEFFRWYAEEAVRTDGAYGESPAGGSRTIVTHRPVGVAALVTPWNFPAAMAARKIAPALAAGCTVVLKPAAETPLTALAITELLAAAGVPRGVVNVVTSTDAAGVVDAWLDDERVRKLSFTGSTGVGRALLAKASSRVISTSMELGGNAPFVVTQDADLEAAVAGALVAKFRNNGQACTAANRFFVHAAVLDEFVERLCLAVANVEATPLISERARDGVAALVERAVEQGATIAHQGQAPAGRRFFPATVLTDVPASADILAAEIFGPVAPIVRWSDEAELLRWVNGTEMGLAAYVYAELGRALRLAERIEAGMVGVNRGVISDPAAPFGGLKQSGVGREGARDGLRAFQETQYLSVDWPSSAS